MGTRLFYLVTMTCLILPTLISCNSVEKASSAEVELYCYEVIDSVNSSFSVELLYKIDSILQMPADYILTQKTADGGWPYFGLVDRDQSINSDSLMFPHTTKHRLVSSGSTCIGAEKKLTILLQTDSTHKGIIFTDMTWHRKSGTWEILASPGSEVLSKGTLNLQKTSHYIANSAIRTTFK